MVHHNDLPNGGLLILDNQLHQYLQCAFETVVVGLRVDEFSLPNGFSCIATQNWSVPDYVRLIRTPHRTVSSN